MVSIKDWCVLETPLLIVSWTAQPGCHQICTEIEISVFMSQKWYYNHVFFFTFFSAVIYYFSSKAAACLEVFFFLFFCYKLLSFFFFSIMYILCKCYSIYGIPVIVYYVVYVTWKPAIKDIIIIIKPVLNLHETYFMILTLSNHQG